MSDSVTETNTVQLDETDTISSPVKTESTVDEALDLVISDQEDKQDVKIPENIADIFEPLTREQEALCGQIYAELENLFLPPSHADFGILVVRTMEIVEKQKISSEDKRKFAIRCIVEFIRDSDDFPISDKVYLMRTVPASVEAIVKLTKGEPLNRDIKEARTVQTTYVTKRALTRILAYIKKNNYDIDAILENSWFITMELMYVVGGYPSLTGPQKKGIVIDVFKKIISDLEKEGHTVNDLFLQTTLDTLPALVDTFVNVANGEYNINELATACCFGLAVCLRVVNKNKKSNKPDFVPM